MPRLSAADARHLRIVAAGVLAVAAAVGGCGKAKPYDQGEDLGSATLGGGGETRVVSGRQVDMIAGVDPTTIVTRRKTLVKKRRLLPRPTFEIVRVQKIVPAQDVIGDWQPGATPPYDWEQADLPFFYASTLPRAMEPYPGAQPPRDTQWPVKFTFAYPQNNFQFKEARLVVDTQRDNSDTEGIYVDGVFSGRPPNAQLAGIDGRITDPDYRIYVSDELAGGTSSGTGQNRQYIRDALENYRRDQINSFYLDVAHLIETSPLSSYDVVKDGRVDVVLGDDSPIYKAYLVIKGDTISSSGLHCTTSSQFDFRNHLVHHDGNSIGQPAFTGNVGAPYQSYAAPASYDATEFYFNTQLPDAKADDVAVTSAKLRLRKVKYNAAGGACATIVINGVGVSGSACNRGLADASVVDSWDAAAAQTTAWSTFVGSLNNAGTTDVDLDLVGLFGAAKVKTLLKQGKLNVALANGLVSASQTTAAGNAQTASTARTYGVGVDGPELLYAGTYTIQDCDVPDDADSPMTEAGFVEPPYVPQYEDYTEEVWEDEVTTVGGSSGSEDVTNDGAGPVLASIQVQDVTSGSAVVYWSSDEPSTSQVLYGIGAIGDATTEDTSLVTFHKVAITGLAPFKYYSYQVVSKDKFGNPSSSAIAVFTTLR
jgi:hypothetical protein